MFAPFYLIVALDAEGGMACHGAIPWKSPTDMAFFKAVTCTKDFSKTLHRYQLQIATPKNPDHQINKNSTVNNAVVMGRKTWESLPEQYRPLPNRHNWILSRSQLTNTAIIQANNSASIHTSASIENAILEATNLKCPTIFCVGGADIYQQAMLIPYLTGIIITRLPTIFSCDVFFPKIPLRFTRDSQSYPMASKPSGLCIEYWSAKN